MRWLTEYQRGSIFGAVMFFVAFAAALSTIPHSQTYPSNQTGTQIEDKQPQPETFWESVSGGDALATITSLLVIVGAIQAVLFLGQLKFIREGLVDTKEAVELGRREFNATHRPLLIIRDIVRERENIIYAIVNKGDAEATIVESWTLAEIIYNRTIVRPLRSFGHDDLGRLTFGVGQLMDLPYRIPREVSMSVTVLDHAGSPAFWPKREGVEYHFAGTIVYEDLAGQRRRTVFRRRWDHDVQGFRRLDDPDQEYSD